MDTSLLVLKIPLTMNMSWLRLHLLILSSILKQLPNLVKFTNSGLGTIGLSTTGSGTNLVFTPNPSIDVEVRAFGLTLKTFDNNTDTKILDLGNTQLISTTGDYTGTEYDKNQDFDLTS